MIKKKACKTKKGRWSAEYTVKLDITEKKKGRKTKGAWGVAEKAHAWKVMVNGKDSGIVESNYPYASKYWRNKAKKAGIRVELRRI